jgi:hypothetical protein
VRGWPQPESPYLEQLDGRRLLVPRRASLGLVLLHVATTHAPPDGSLNPITLPREQSCMNALESSKHFMELRRRAKKPRAR